MALQVQLITNRGPFAAGAGMIHIPVAVYGLHRAPQLAMVDTNIALCPAETQRLVSDLTPLVGWPDPAVLLASETEGGVSACRAIEPSPVRVWR
ncbi:hypothetical protein RM780_24270 [Streptomyces sp. DSM 44917]|uniref:Uncharacterized protein n=1 Tax=Streptomyces boetiae TaxID=3075541 RepID=A0ABU2LEP5_9ACTN|nr:hypothetical protein [Streptomyces sp. DSM 44917]MDT0310045.1 hypothetical protein [Streptomyces sp. DSM 44917]